ncbi:MAG: carbamoyl-phosphate synthase large subunit [Desulfobacteraceae bacterium]|nr:carbamoyl-phosphate synthase large subunit [Desulfobacteraceae bacterium]
MPKRTDIRTILLIGSGPSMIGLDHGGHHAETEACITLGILGYKVVAVNSNLSTTMSDIGTADRTYIEPLTRATLLDIIQLEKPEGILTGFGGKTEMNMVCRLSQSGALNNSGVRVLGVDPVTVETCEDRVQFIRRMIELEIPVLDSQIADNIEAAIQYAGELKFPLLVRPSYSRTGMHPWLVYNVEEFRNAAERCLADSYRGKITIQEAKTHWQEYEFVCLRDDNNGVEVIGGLENIDPLGIHCGDSISVTPVTSVAGDTVRQLHDLCVRVMQKLSVTGVANLRFARSPETGEIVIIGINCRYTRTSNLIAFAGGIPLCKDITRLSCGFTLAEISSEHQKYGEAFKTGATKTAVKIPRWSIGNYTGADNILDTRMKSVGEVIGIGNNLKNALLRSIRSLDLGTPAIGIPNGDAGKTIADIYNELGVPTTDRLFRLYAAFAKNPDDHELVRITGISHHFIREFRELFDLEKQISAFNGQQPDADLYKQAKTSGFSDQSIAELLGMNASQFQVYRDAAKLYCGYEPVTDADPSIRILAYSTVKQKTRISKKAEPSVLVIGGGPDRIGQSGELDYGVYHAVRTLQEIGLRTIVVNCSPLSGHIGHGGQHVQYIAPRTLEDIVNICRLENPMGVVVQFAGDSTEALSMELQKKGIPVLGTPADVMSLVVDTFALRQRMRTLGIPQPAFALAADLYQAKQKASEVGYPVILRSSDAVESAGDIIVHNEGMLAEKFETSTDNDKGYPLLIEQFLEYAIETEADALADGSDIFVPAVVEHVELAGVHAGDSACVMPPYSTPLRHVDTIEECMKKIGAELGVKGLLNCRFAIYKDTVYLLEVRCRAVRTLPLVSKTCNIPMPELATRILMGSNLADFQLKKQVLPYFCVKASVFPFTIFPEVDPIPGPVMQSTGQAHGISDNYGMAYFKSLEAVSSGMPLEGTVLITVTDEDKPSILEPARRFLELGFTIKATRGTCDFLNKNGIKASSVKKIGFGRPNLVDDIKTGKVDIIINSPSGENSQVDDSYIRKAAIQYKTPNMTTPAAALAVVKALEAGKKADTPPKPLQTYYQMLR